MVSIPIEAWRNQTPQPTKEITAFSETYPLTQVVEMSLELFEWGGLTQLQFRMKREGTAPPDISPFGGPATDPDIVSIERLAFIVHWH